MALVRAPAAMRAPSRPARPGRPDCTQAPKNRARRPYTASHATRYPPEIRGRVEGHSCFASITSPATFARRLTKRSPRPPPCSPAARGSGAPSVTIPLARTPPTGKPSRGPPTTTNAPAPPRPAASRTSSVAAGARQGTALRRVSRLRASPRECFMVDVPMKGGRAAARDSARRSRPARFSRETRQKGRLELSEGFLRAFRSPAKINRKIQPVVG